MKIARIILTATILFSLKSTSFCSAPTAASEEFEILASPTTLPSEKKSSQSLKIYDGSFHGATRETFANLGTTFKRYLGLGEECIYGIESDEQAALRWAPFGKTINNLTDAKKWLTLIDNMGWTLPEESIKPALDLINADKEKRIAANITLFESMQQESFCLLAKIIQMQESRKNEDLERSQFYAQEIKKITDAKTLEFQLRLQARKEEDTKLNIELTTLLEETKTHKINHNKQYPDHTITTAPVIKREDVKDLNPNTLATIALKYQSMLKAAQQNTKK